MPRPQRWINSTRWLPRGRKAGLTALLMALNAYSTADISSAQAYLRALKKRVQ